MDGSGVWMNGLWTPHTNSATSGVFGLSTSVIAIARVSPMLLLSVGFCESGNKGFVERLVEAAVVTP